MNKIKKITKFKKSKKTNNKRNHKRRRMTRKLRGGVIKQEWPLGTPQTIPSYNEPPQRKELVTREDYDILRDKIDTLMDDLDGVMDGLDTLRNETTEYETMVPLIFGSVDNGAIFINKNITALSNKTFLLYNDGPVQNNYSSYVLDLYQLIKFKRLQKIDFNIIQSFTILLPRSIVDIGMPSILRVPRIASNEEARSRNRKLYNFFEDNLSSNIKYIYRSSTRIDSPPIEYDLEDLENILIQDLSLSPEREPNGASSSRLSDEVEAKTWYHKGKKYLKSSDNRVYDAKTQERIGIWNEEEDMIEEISE